MTNKTAKTTHRPISYSLIALFLILSTIIISWAYFYYANEKKHAQKHSEDNLKTIAQLKAEQIITWRDERIIDAKSVSEGSLFLSIYEKWLRGGKKENRDREILLNRLIVAQTISKHHSLALLDKNGKISLSTNEGDFAAGDFVDRHFQEALKTRKIIFGDFYLCPASQKILIDVLAPLIAKREKKDILLGALLLRIDPQEYLYPMLQFWPVVSKTSETLLVRREGESVSYLNDLRHKKGAALSLKIPLNDQIIPAATAFRNEEGIANGRDYRGIMVIAFIKHLPDSSWYLIVKTDIDEAFATIHFNLLMFTIICASLIILSGVLIWLSFSVQGKNYYKKLYLSEKERKQAQEALQESEEKYRQLFEMESDALFLIDKDTGMILEVNPAACQLYGYTRDELLRMKDTDLSAEPEETKRATVGKSDAVPVRYHEHHNGTIFPVEINASYLMYNGREVQLAAIRDITNRRHAEDALRQSEEKYRSLLNKASDAILIADTNGNILDANKKAEELFGYAVQELLDLNISQIHPPEELPIIQDTFLIIARKGSGLINDTAVLKKNGDVVPVDITGSLIEYGHLQVLQGIFRNISERKRALEERRRLEERLQRSEKMEALGMLAGGVAHDLNNVLGIIVGYSELLLHELNEQSPARKRIENILNSGERATAIVQDLLTLARRGVQTRKVLNLNDIIDDYLKSAESARLSSFHSQVQINTDMEADILNIMGSPIHLTKTLMNLISNAAEAMAKGGTLTIKTENCYIDKPIKGYDEVKTGDYVVLTVTDTGEGISPEDMKRIFEPFYTKKIMGRSGTGLGLAVVWGTVKDANGYIDVQSEPGKGTSFILYFPVTAEIVSAQQLPVSAAQYMGKGESILVVDDVKEQRELATQMLAGLNYHVQSVASGEEAIVYLREHKADIIILDMIMDPGRDGLENYKNILEICPKQKAIIVSGFSETDRVRKAQALGAGAYIKKPYIQAQLGLAVRKELDKA